MGRETGRKNRRAKLPVGQGLYVAHVDVARGLSMLLPSPAGVRIARCGVTELEFGSCAEGIQIGRGDGRCVSWRQKPVEGELPRARRGRGRTGWIPSGSTSRQEPVPLRRVRAVAAVGLAAG